MYVRVRVLAAKAMHLVFSLSSHRALPHAPCVAWGSGGGGGTPVLVSAALLLF